jgi:hypothetical protein
MEANSESKLPTSFWVIAVLGLLWNLFGAYLYVMARVDPETALAGASPEMRDYVANQPIWANLGYGFGIWGSALGSVAMILRKKIAAPLFLTSLIGAAISHLGQAMAGVIPIGLTIVIMGVIAFLWWYSRRCVEQGLLR